MRLTIQLKLQPTPEQAQALLHTLEAANVVCNHISEIAWNSRTFKQFDIHRLVYATMREQSKLSSQLVVRCIAKVADAYKLDRERKRDFRLRGAVAFDERILSYKTDTISIWTTAGRQTIPFVCGPRQRELLANRVGESDLSLVRGQWFLFTTAEIETPEPIDIDGVLGVDLGIVTIATDSDGESHTGSVVEQKRQWYAKRRAALQSVGTKSAKRRLKRLSGRQRRFQANENHRISKELVAKAERTKRAIALEDLKGIRTRTRVSGPRQRARYANWAFFQLRSFLSYKAQMAGVPVALINPAYTSQTCSACGHCERANRKTQAHFCCVVCGHTAPADFNAALTIRDRAAVILPMVAASGRVTSRRL